MEKLFSRREVIRFGWEATKKNFWFFCWVLMIVFVVSGISSFANKGMEKAPFFAGLINLTAVIFGIIIQMGIIKITLKITDGQTPVFDDLFSETKLFWRYAGATLVYAGIVVAGLVLFIVPGIIWGLKFQFYRYLIVDKKMGIMESFRKSAEITTDAKLDLFLLGLLFLGITAIGVLSFGIGLFVAVPVVMIATAFVYRKLLARVPSADVAVPAQ
ncbi:MAG: DUF975 family protein [Candidatus Liptonbacteria bacterium]|nr:DUF975 family protein [Candidatus Liptonbacteria bacterium]